MPTALVIGGTGPTGPVIVDGLLQRGYGVTILHSGRHEVPFAGEVHHLHADVHFRETLSSALGKREWDVVFACYGRLKLTAELIRGHTDRVIAVGGATASLATSNDPRWGRMGRPHDVAESEEVLEHDSQANKFGFRMAEAERALFDSHTAGHYRATYIGYPILYGPRQPGAHDWSIVKRALDKRRSFIVADGGFKVESRAYVDNAAAATLLALDRSDLSSGQKYVVSDEHLFTMRQRIEAIAAYLDHRFEIVDMPYDLAVPAHVLWRGTRGNRVRDTAKIRHELGYRPPVEPYDALTRTVDWLSSMPAADRAELEHQLGDPFDYRREDQLVDRWRTLREGVSASDFPTIPRAHMYRHPSRVNEEWRRPLA